MIYGWRAVHSVPVNPPVRAGLAPTEREAKRCAADAMRNPAAALAQVIPIDLVDGEWRLGLSIIGLRTLSGDVKWWDAEEGIWTRTEED
jgi:hypothetical protein